MKSSHDIISIRGKTVKVGALKVDGIEVIITGRVLKTGWILDEDWLEIKSLPNLMDLVSKLCSLENRPDIFVFAQRIPDTEPHYPYHYEWESAAVATIESYASWFETAIDRSVRKHIKKSQREGIVSKVVPFDDHLVEGIYSIYNEKEVRQGKRFWHYGKPLEQVKRENGTYLARSVFIGAYLAEELVGFLKMLLDEEVATIMQIVSKTAQFSKRPNNALISKAVEECELRKAKYLIYGRYTYGKKKEGSLIDFKEKNGFRKVDYPKYYIPLTARGRFALKTGLHKGWTNLMPGPVTTSLIKLRTMYYSLRKK
jgi:hypothetical protein